MSGLSTQGYALLRLGNLASARAHLLEGLKMAREAGRPRTICDLRCNLAITYLALNDLASARSALLESLSLAQSLGLCPQKTVLPRRHHTCHVPIEFPGKKTLFSP